MKNKALLLITITCGLILFSCAEDEEKVSERFVLLTTPVWSSDSLLVNGEDAGGPGQILEKFRGEAKFYTDGTGYFGQYAGTWRFARNEADIVILTDSLPVALTTTITELTAVSLKINTGFPDPVEPDDLLLIRMTFMAK